MSVKTLYTNTVPQDIAGVVRAIPAPDGCTKFQSAPTTYDEGKDTWTQWASAWQNPQSGLWTLETHQRFVNADSGNTKAGDNNSTRQKKTIAKNVSFFDALHFCAYEEITRVSAGASIVMTDADDTSHYKTIATKALQPVDVQGIPHPAAFGEILTDGMFDDAAYNLAKQTVKQELDINSAPSVNAPQLIDFGSVGDIETGQHQRVLKTTMDKSRFIEHFAKAVEAVNYKNTLAQRERAAPKFLPTMFDDLFQLKMDFSEASYKEMMHFFSYVAGGMVGAFTTLLVFAEGVSAYAPFMAGGIAYGGIKSLRTLPTIYEAVTSRVDSLKARMAFNRDVKSLPDCNLKNDLIAYRQMIKAVDHFARAAQIVEKHGYVSQRKLKRAFDHVSKGAKIANMSEIETEQLRMMLAEERFPKAFEFEQRLSVMQEQIQNAFATLKDEIETTGSVPQIESKQEIPLDAMNVQKTKVPRPE